MKELVKVNRAYVSVRMSFDTYEVFSEELYEKKTSMRNDNAKSKGKYSKRHNINLNGSKEDRTPQVTTITRGNKSVLIPTEWMTKTGKIKKSKLDYINMVLSV